MRRRRHRRRTRRRRVSRARRRDTDSLAPSRGQEQNAPRLKEVDVRLRLIAPVLLVLAATAGAFALTRTDSTGDAWFVLVTGLALAAVTAIAISYRRTRHSLALLADEQ